MTPKVQDSGNVVGTSVEKAKQIKNQNLNAQIVKTILQRICHKSVPPTFQAMNDDIEFLFHQQFFQFLGPDTFSVEFLERFDLVLVGHCADHLGFVLGAWCIGLEVFDDHVDLSDGQL